MKDLDGPFRQPWCSEGRRWSSESLSVLVRIRLVRSQHGTLGLCPFPLKRLRGRLSCEVASAEDDASSQTSGIYVWRLPVNKKEQATKFEGKGIAVGEKACLCLPGRLPSSILEQGVRLVSRTDRHGR